MIFEVCVDSIEGAQAAQEGGAQRIELCADLVEGGITPSVGMIRLARQYASLTIHVLIRPRAGDFCNTPVELEVMKHDIMQCKKIGADGVVLGLLLPNGEIDVERTRALVDLARPLSVTFHRAFDLCRDPFASLETLINLGIDRLLTSGQKPTALEGAPCIAQLVQQSAGRIAILAGGGVTPSNLKQLVTATGVNEVHFSARQTIPSPMQFRIPGVAMGKAYQPDEYERKAPDIELIRRMIQTGESIL